MSHSHTSARLRGPGLRAKRLPRNLRYQRGHDLGHGKMERSGAAQPRFPVTKDPQICDPDSKKTTDLERLIVGPQAGVANTVVYLKNISSGKALDLPEQRRHLDQRHCRYIPHILLVPENAVLNMQSSDATLHTVHMDGAATFNLPFPFVNQVTSRTMATPGLVHLRCKAVTSG